MVMVLNGTFNNISVIYWWSVLLVDETGVHWKTKLNYRHSTSHWQALSHTVVSPALRHQRDSDHSNSKL